MVFEHPHTGTGAFEQLYLAVRQQEARVYTDEEVARLPQTAPGHPHRREWEVRKRSANRLINYLHDQQRPLKILEVGCGNGWLSAMLARLPSSEVLGIDINEMETEQARRVFTAPGLTYKCSGFDAGAFSSERFDIIIFAAALPYFRSVSNTISFALSLLRPQGELHIIDTHFYDVQSTANAAQRCREYYQAMDLPEMADHYYHHQLKDLSRFRYQVLIDPHSLVNRLVKKEPFYWIIVKPEGK